MGPREFDSLKKWLTLLHPPAQGLRNGARGIIHCAGSRALLYPEFRVQGMDVREHFKLSPFTRLWYTQSQNFTVLARLTSFFVLTFFLFYLYLYLISSKSLSWGRRSATDAFNYPWWLGYGLDRREVVVNFPTAVRDLWPFQNVWTGSQVYAASCSMGPDDLHPGG